MDTILKQGRLLYAIAIAAFGIINIVCAHRTDPSIPVMPWVPSYPWLAYATGIVLLAAAICIAFHIYERATAIFLGFFFLVCTLLIQVPKVIAAPLDVGIRTTFFETLTMSSAALILALSLPSTWNGPNRLQAILNGFLHSGRYLFAVAAIVFGIDHYLVFNLIVSLIPHWIPGTGWFWTHLTALAFIAAGLSIAAGVLDRLAATLLGLMFLLWFLFLHAPRIMSYPRSHDPDEWSSAFIALGICGAAWLLAASPLVHGKTVFKLEKVK